MEVPICGIAMLSNFSLFIKTGKQEYSENTLFSLAKIKNGVRGRNNWTNNFAISTVWVTYLLFSWGSIYCNDDYIMIMKKNTENLNEN